MTKPPEKPLPWPGFGRKPVILHLHLGWWAVQHRLASRKHRSIEFSGKTKEEAIATSNREVRRAWARIEKARK